MPKRSTHARRAGPPGCNHDHLRRSRLGRRPQEPTLASVWQAVAGTTIGDKLLEWPPDLFTLTDVILQRSQAYRFALSPPPGATWPPASLPDWPDAVTGAARRWSAWAEDRQRPVPDLLAQAWGVLRAPGRVEAVTADAQAGAPWRAELRICEPSPPLSHAINDMSQAARTAVATGVNPPLEAALAAVHESQPDRAARGRLARAVLRSALEQRQNGRQGRCKRSR